MKTLKEKLDWKFVLKTEGLHLLEARLKTLEEAIRNARDSANSDEKSSAGDKYETGRAMGQIDIEMNSRQLQKGMEELQLLHALDVSQAYNQARTGACVLSEAGQFFVGIGLGIHQISNKEVIYLSPLAPLARLLLNKQKGDQFQFKGKSVEITDVF